MNDTAGKDIRYMYDSFVHLTCSIRTKWRLAFKVIKSIFASFFERRSTFIWKITARVPYNHNF